MQKLQLFFRKTVKTIEENPLPIKYYLFLFAAILTVRLCLEFFANQRLFRQTDVIHISLWFIFIIEAFMLQLHVFTKTDVIRIVKLVTCCFSIALTAPIIDMVISQGKFSKMNYLSVHSFQDVFWSYLTIGGASLSRGATIGIRIEIVLLVIASFNYIYVKTGSLFRSLIGTFSIYTVLFLSGLIPLLINGINSLLHLHYGPDDQSTVYLLFLVDLILLLLLVFRSKSSNTIPRFSFVFIVRIVTAFGLCASGILIARNLYPANWILDPTTLYYFPLLFIVIALLLYTHRNNSLTDFSAQSGILFLLLTSSYLISFYTCFAVLLAWGIQFLLFEFPLQLQRIPVLNSLLYAGLNTSFFLIGFMSFGAPMIGVPTYVLFFILLGSFSIHLAYIYIRKRGSR